MRIQYGAILVGIGIYVSFGGDFHHWLRELIGIMICCAGLLVAENQVTRNRDKKGRFAK